MQMMLLENVGSVSHSIATVKKGRLGNKYVVERKAESLICQLFTQLGIN